MLTDADSNGLQPVALSAGPLAHLHLVILEPTRLLVSAPHFSWRAAHEHAEPRRHHRHHPPRDRPRTPNHLTAALFREAALRVLHPQDLRTKNCDDGTNGTVLFIFIGMITA